MDIKGELNAEQQEKLRQFKIETRIDNEKYLRAHPEIEEMIGDFLRKLLLQRPDDVRQFAADHFSNLNSPTGPLLERNSDVE